MKKTFENRGHVLTVEQFEQVMAFENDEAMQNKWKAFCRKIDTKTDSYSSVLRTIRSFLRKPIAAAINKDTFNQEWVLLADCQVRQFDVGVSEHHKALM